MYVLCYEQKLDNGMRSMKKNSMYRIFCDLQILLLEKKKREVQLPAAIKSQIHETDAGLISSAKPRQNPGSKAPASI